MKPIKKLRHKHTCQHTIPFIPFPCFIYCSLLLPKRSIKQYYGKTETNSKCRLICKLYANKKESQEINIATL